MDAKVLKMLLERVKELETCMEFTYAHRSRTHEIDEERDEIQRDMLQYMKKLHQAVISNSPSAVLMENTNCSVAEELLLCPEDFPECYVNFAHPDDYKIYSGTPPLPQFIYNHRRGKHNRIICRIAWMVDANSYFIMSFVNDTGAPKHMYLSPLAIQILEKNDLLKNDQDMNIIYVIINGKKVVIEETPSHHGAANLMGLPLLRRFQLTLSESDPGASYHEDVKCIKA